MSKIVGVADLEENRPTCSVQVIRAKDNGNGVFVPIGDASETYRALMDTGSNGCAIISSLPKTLRLTSEDKVYNGKTYKPYVAYIRLIGVEQYKDTLFQCSLFLISEKDDSEKDDSEKDDSEKDDSEKDDFPRVSPSKLAKGRQLILGRNFMEKSEFTYDGPTGKFKIGQTEFASSYQS